MTDGIASEEVGENGRVLLNKGRMKLNILLKVMMDGECSDTSKASSSEGAVRQRGKLLVTGNPRGCFMLNLAVADTSFQFLRMRMSAMKRVLLCVKLSKTMFVLWSWTFSLPS